VRVQGRIFKKVSSISNVDGGLVQYGSTNWLSGEGNPVEIQISEEYFSGFRGVLPIIDVKSWQEAVSKK
jgi:hypothetical protein